MKRASAELGSAKIEPKRSDRWNRAGKASLVGVLAGLSLVGVGSRPGRASENGGALMMAAFDSIGEQPDPSVANRVIGKIASVGFGELKEEVVVPPGQTRPSKNDNLALINSFAAANAAGMEVILMFAAPTWNNVAADPPLRPNQARNFCDFVKNVADEFPQQVAAVEIENEVNNPVFWPHQFSPSGVDAVAAPEEALLARCYDDIQALNAKDSTDIKVIGGGLAPRGNDDPHSKRPSLSPVNFILDLGKAYRASGRTQPIMDIFGIHPYVQPGDSLKTVHPAPSTTITAGDYSKLVYTLGQAFDFPGSGQEGASLPILYDEFAERVDDSPHPAPGTVSSATQAEDYAALTDMSRCQPTVIGDIFFKVVNNPQWTSGEFNADGTPTKTFKAIQQTVIAAQQAPVTTPQC